MPTPTTQPVTVRRVEPIKAQFDVFGVPDTFRERIASLLVAGGALQAYSLQKRCAKLPAAAALAGLFMAAGAVKDGNEKAAAGLIGAEFLKSNQTRRGRKRRRR